MTDVLWKKIFDPTTAFDHPLTSVIAVFVGAVLLAAPLILEILFRARVVSNSLRSEIYARFFTWLILVPAIAVPILIGHGAAILAIGMLSLLCYREFARATGFFRDRLLSAVVVLGIFLLAFAELDHWYDFFVAIPSLTIALLAVVALRKDKPHGYLQRVAIGAFAFLLFGVCLGHFGYMANDREFRPIMLWLLLSIEMNDVFAFLVGKAIGRYKLAPNTSPNKTIEGSLGALLLTTALCSCLGHLAFRGGTLDTPLHLVALGLLVSFSGQCGDLLVSSVKRDLGLKDMGVLLPGHGGLLDRFDSLIVASPAVFHYVGYFRGFGLDQPVRILSG